MIIFLKYLLKKYTIFYSDYNKHMSDYIQQRCERHEERSYTAITLRIYELKGKGYVLLFGLKF